MSRPNGRRRRRDRGQALAEVAFVAPLFFMTLFGIIDLARVIWANDTVSNAAREGARYASVHAGTPGLTVPVEKDAIKSETLAHVIAGGVGTTVTVCFSEVKIAEQAAVCTGDTNGFGAGYGRGNLVTVVVTSRVPIVTGALTGLGDFTVTGSSTVLINN